MGLIGRGLGDDQPGAGGRVGALRVVLGHQRRRQLAGRAVARQRRHHDAVGQLDVAEADGVEEKGWSWRRVWARARYLHGPWVCGDAPQARAVAQSRMLAYRHAFHAGNHADVLKHLVLLAVLQHLNQKDKGWRCIDTHAGAGGYSLEGGYAQKKAEYADGIGRLWTATTCRPPWPTGGPGARLQRRQGPEAVPRLAGHRARCHAAQDQLRLFELHPTDHKHPGQLPGRRARREVKMSDGFDAPEVAAAAAHAARRGADRPELRGQDRLRAHAGGAARGAGASPTAPGHRLVPQVQPLEAAQLPQRLKALPRAKGWLHARLTVAPAGCAGLRPGRQRRVRDQPALHAARPAAAGAALAGGAAGAHAGTPSIPGPGPSRQNAA
jgi:23S rRNA (adenine2030-N6)-methyltransferase